MRGRLQSGFAGWRGRREPPLLTKQADFETLLFNVPSLISTQNVNKYILPNGLTVLLETVNAAPVISFNIGVKVGSVWEADHEAGLSHLLEHMVFKGTKTYGAGEIAVKVEASGGELNAYTSFDQTVYFINLGARHWKTGLNLIKEMALDALIDPVELEREKEVVVEEIRRGKDSPHNQLSEMLFSTAFKKHPYGRPIIGFEKTVRGFPRDKVWDFYRRWYVPNNMVLGICGDFNEVEMKAEVERLFGGYANRPITRHPIATEPPLTAPLLAQKRNPVTGHYVNLAFPIPGFAHEDIPAVDLLAHYLGDGETSRLHQIVKEQKKLVNSIHAYAYTPSFPGLFIVDALVPKEKIPVVVPAIFEEIDFCRETLMPADQLKRAKLNMKSALFYEKETCEGTARKWMVYETTVNDFRFEETYLKKIDAVTSEDIRIAARKYLKKEAILAAYLHPEKDNSSLSLPGTGKRGKVSRTAIELLEETNGIKKFKIKPGITLVTRENNRLPLVSLRLSQSGGLRFETKANNGITNLTTSLLEKGTRTKNAFRIAEISEEIAGHVEGFAGRNSWGLSQSCLSEKLDTGIELFCDFFLNPAFGAEELAKEKTLTLEAIKNQEDSLSSLAFQKFQALLFKKHPYGMSLLGTKNSVARLKRDEIIAFYKKMRSTSGMVIAAAGDFKPEEMARQLSEGFSPFQSTGAKPPRIPREEPPRSPRREILKRKKMQAHVVLGFQGTTFFNPDRYAFEVLNNVLAGQGGRLFLELRDKQSLAYSITSVLTEGVEPGFFAAYIGSEPGKVEAALTGIQKELERVRTEKIPREEMERAKNYIVGNHEIDLQRNSAVAATLASNELFGYPLAEFEDYSKKIMAVTAEEVLAVTQKYLKPQSSVLTIIKP